MMINSMKNLSFQLPFQIKEIHTKICRFHTNNTPFFFLRSNKRKKTKHTKEKEIGWYDLKEPNEKSHRLLMSFTRVPAQSDRREESKGSISSSQQQKLKKNEEGHKIWTIRCLLLKRKHVKGQRKHHWITKQLSKWRNRVWTSKKWKFWRDFGQKRAGALV